MSKNKDTNKQKTEKNDLVNENTNVPVLESKTNEEIVTPETGSDETKTPALELTDEAKNTLADIKEVNEAEASLKPSADAPEAPQNPVLNDQIEAQGGDIAINETKSALEQPDNATTENTEAQGPLPTVDNPPAWVLKYRDDMKANGTIDPKASRIEVLERSINRCFEDHEKTALPKLTEAEVLSFVGKQGDGIKIEFIYTNDEKTSGYITLKEFDVIKRCPKVGEFTFGIDYSKGV